MFIKIITKLIRERILDVNPKWERVNFVFWQVCEEIKDDRGDNYAITRYKEKL